MGTNSKTAHYTYSIAPTAPPPTAATEHAASATLSQETPLEPAELLDAGVVGAAPEVGEEAPPPEEAAAELLEQAQQTVGQEVDEDELVGQFAHFAGLIAQAGKQIELAEQSGVDPSDVQDLRAKAHKVSLDYLNGLGTAQLQQLAAADGFEHPALVGLSGNSPHPLVHWLDPSYDPDLKSKAKIQQVALDRYAKLTAGQTVGGMTLADLHQIEGTASTTTAPQPSGSAASPAESTPPSQPVISDSTLAAIAASGKPQGFATKHNNLMAALQHARATASDLPERLDAVASWEFGPGSAANLGGVHTKSLHTAPDGSSWMFKPDKSYGGVRGHVEAAASAAFHAGGVPSVPVYATEINGQKGSIQPLLKGATNLSPHPGKWSQADVDAMVRTHVASWLVGDHDGHNANVLRTASGGLVPIDQGAAFKFYGADKLSLDYNPHSGHGTGQPVYQIAYKAHQKGDLAAGVKVNPAAAHPVIKAYEQIPDATWRAMLASTAHEGAKNNFHWVPAMRKRAAAQHGIPAKQVTHGQIAEAFLDHACERKKNLRADFADFFTNQVNLPTGALLRHRG